MSDKHAKIIVTAVVMVLLYAVLGLVLDAHAPDYYREIPPPTAKSLSR